MLNHKNSKIMETNEIKKTTEEIILKHVVKCTDTFYRTKLLYSYQLKNDMYITVLRTEKLDKIIILNNESFFLSHDLNDIFCTSYVAEIISKNFNKFN